MSRFACKVEGDSRAADLDEVRRALDILIGPGQTYEVRGIWRSPDFARSRVCRTIDEGVDAVEGMQDAAGVYFTLNPCRAGLDKAAANPDIESRRWILIDCDPVKPADLSATDAEREASIDLACTISEALAAAGWPDAVWIESGNGAHLLYPCDLPADKLSQQLIRDALAALGDRHDTPAAKVDRAVHNAARVSKLPGTWVRKGPDTPDRPNRRARLIRAPEHGGEVVTAAMLRELAAKPKAETPSPWTARATDGGGLKRYVRSAVERECTRVLMAPEGTRNNALNTAAFNLATMAGWPEMDAADAKLDLYRAATRAGLSEREVKLTIESGWTAGAKEDRPRPQETLRKAGVPEKPPEPEGRLVIFGSEVETKRVRWLWPDRIAVGFISIFAGRTGVGKSFVLCDFAARLTTGGLIPESIFHLPKGRVLMISEDPYDYVLTPRLKELGADMDSVGFMTWDAMAAWSLGNTDMLTRAWQEAGEPVLLVIDPPSNFLMGADEHKNAEVRGVLMKLVAWLSERQVACVFVSHLNKAGGKGIEAVDRVVGSVAWASTSRVIVAFAPDPNNEDQCLMAGVKNNLGPKAETLAYSIEKTDALATVQWRGKSETSASDALSGTKKKTKGQCAVEWLEERFRERREWESDELKRAASEAGISKNALWSDEAKALPIRKRPVINAAGDKTYHWIAEEGWPLPAEECVGKA